MRQARPRGGRALTPGDRRGARGGGSPAGCLLDDAAEGEPDRQRGGRRSQHPGRPARGRPARLHAGDARARCRGVAGGVGRPTPRIRCCRRRPRRGTAGRGGPQRLPRADAGQSRRGRRHDHGGGSDDGARRGGAGRADAHRLVSEASSLARDDGISLRAALEQTLAPELLAAMPPLERVLDPGSYLGESDAVVTAALEGWRRVTPRSGRAAGRAPS